MNLSTTAFLLLAGTASGQGFFPNAPQASLSGLVQDLDGKPVASRVTIYQLQIQDGEEHPIARCGVDTDVDGKFSCSGLTPGRYTVLARAALRRIEPAYLSTGSKVTAPTKPVQSESYFPAFYPGVNRGKDAVALTLKKGEEGYAAIRLTPTSLVRLQGALRSKPDLAVFTLSLPIGQTQLATNYSVAYTSTSGEFQTEPIPPGSYVLSVDWFEQRANHHWSSTVEVSDQSKSVQIEEIRTRVQGRLQVEEGSSASLPKTINMQCGVSGSKTLYSSQVLDDGGFNFTSVPTGECRLQVLSDKKLSIRTIKSRGRDLPLQRILVGTSPVALEVELASIAGQLAGTLSEDPDKYPQTGVVLQSLKSGDFTVLRPNDKGEFLNAQIDPSEYRVCAWENFAETAYRSSAAQDRCLRDGTTVRIEPGHVTKIELRPIAYRY